MGCTKSPQSIKRGQEHRKRRFRLHHFCRHRTYNHGSFLFVERAVVEIVIVFLLLTTVLQRSLILRSTKYAEHIGKVQGYFSLSIAARVRLSAS